MLSQNDMNFDIIGHFEKSTKNTFWVKTSYMNMVDSIEMRPKGLLIGHPNISKKSNNTSLGSKLRDALAKLALFAKLPKVKWVQNCIFC